MHAVQAECTVEITDLPRLKQGQLASALDDRQLAGEVCASRRRVSTTNAIFRAATGARVWIANGNLQRRYRRTEKVELPDRADVFAERSASKQRIDRQGGHEVSHDQCADPPRIRKQIK